jgi:hypothetical protein
LVGLVAVMAGNVLVFRKPKAKVPEGMVVAK